MGMRAAFGSAVDTAMDAVVAPGFSRVGILVRRRLGKWDDIDAEMTGRVVLITGASSGLGRAAAISLGALGADLVLVGRHRERLDAAAEAAAVAAARKGHHIATTTFIADLSRLSDARALVADVLGRFDRLDVLVHNAGALVHDYRRTADGFEETYAAQVLAQHVITAGLLPLLARTPGARVVVVSSGGMYAEPLVPGQMEFAEEDYDGVRAYARAKRVQVALTGEWARRFGGAGVTFHSMHPGWADTPGVAESLPTFKRFTQPLLRTPEDGADTIVWLAAADEATESNGLFWLDRRPRPTVKLPWAGMADADAARMWDLVCEQAGDTPSLPPAD